MAHTSPEDRERRAAALAPLFAIARQRGHRRGWIADQVGVTIQRLWNYEHGLDRVPPDFVERFASALTVPPSLIVIPEPRDLYIQQPRVKRAPATSKPQKSPTQPKGARHDDRPSDPTSNPSTRRVRRAQRPTTALDSAAPSDRARP